MFVGANLRVGRAVALPPAVVSQAINTIFGIAHQSSRCAWCDRPHADPTFLRDFAQLSAAPSGDARALAADVLGAVAGEWTAGAGGARRRELRLRLEAEAPSLGEFHCLHCCWCVDFALISTRLFCVDFISLI